MGGDGELLRQEELLRKKYGDNLGAALGAAAVGPRAAQLGGHASGVQRKKDLVAARLMNKGLSERKFFDSADASMAVDKAKPKPRAPGAGGLARASRLPQATDHDTLCAASEIAPSTLSPGNSVLGGPRQTADSPGAGVPRLGTGERRPSSLVRVGEMGASEVGQLCGRSEAEIAKLSEAMSECDVARVDSGSARAASENISDESDDYASSMTASPDPSRVSLDNIPELEHMRELPKVVQHAAEVYAMSVPHPKPSSKLAMTDMSRDGSIRSSGTIDLIGEDSR
mmetsp:Transcript_18441/g.45389  ORF Transcript_18441/g.45389 Transcript_18441/m.45389 type:complete len:284 (-) Transcript_18441:37-888(-)